MSKQNIYDNEIFFENFKRLRGEELNFNDVIETPIILGMMPDLMDKKVLDIGCGMGQHAMQYIKMGAKSVLGIDISEKMLAFAKENNSAENIIYRRLAFEDLDLTIVKISSDTLNYLNKKKAAVDPMTRETYDYYMKESVING